MSTKEVKVIGFADVYYTLWTVSKEPVYIIGANGEVHLTGYNTRYCYLQNISISLDKTKELHPDLEIIDDLRGHCKSFTKVHDPKDDMCPFIMKFGKYYSEHIDDLIEKDFDYILWLIDNRSASANAVYAKNHKTVVAYFKQLERDKKKLERKRTKAMDDFIAKGEVTFVAEKNLSGYQLNGMPPSKEDLAFICIQAEEVPYTLLFPASTFQWANYQGHYYALPIVKGKSKRIKGKQITLTFESRTSFDGVSGRFEGATVHKDELFVTGITIH